MKNRWHIWAIGMCAAALLQVLGMFFDYLSYEPTYTELMYEVSSESRMNVLGAQLDGCTTGDRILRQTTTLHPEYQILLTNNDLPSQDIEQYTYYEDFYYSPVVLFIPHAVTKTGSVFSAQKPGDTNKILEKDLRVLLTAVKEGRTWDSIGISKDVMEGEVSLILPDKRNAYYPYVEAMIHYALNDYKPLTRQIVIAQSADVSKIVARCTQVENVVNYVSIMKGQSNKGALPILAPECLISDYTDGFNSSNSNYWQPVYFPSAITVSYDLYIKKSEAVVVEDQESEIAGSQSIINALSQKNILQVSGLRTIEPQYSLDNCTGFSLTSAMVSRQHINMQEYLLWTGILVLEDPMLPGP